MPTTAIRKLIVMVWAAAGLFSVKSAQAIAAPGVQPLNLLLGFDRRDTLYASATLTWYVYLPLVSRPNVCLPIPGASYGTLPIDPWEPTPPAEAHPDLNLAIRGYTPTQALLGLIDLGGDTDPNAPQLASLFAIPRLPAFTAAYQVYNWEWESSRRGEPIDDPEVTLIEMSVTPGETIHVPDSGYEIGSGYEVLVLYASQERLTLKYTYDDNVIYGYTIHLENICVDPALLALYQQLNDAGRHNLPALRARQAMGRARAAGQIGVAIRDNGAFLDPRSHKDWWHDY